MSLKSLPDRPPILRFLLMFAGLLTLATALAALSQSAGASADAPTGAESNDVGVFNGEPARAAEGNGSRLQPGISKPE